MCSPFLAKRSQGRCIHSPPTLLLLYRSAIFSNHESIPWGLSEIACSGPSKVKAGFPSQSPIEGPWKFGGFETGGRYPAAVRHDDRPPREPVAIIDYQVRIALTLDGNQVRANHSSPPLWSWPDPERLGILASQRGAPEPEFVNRSRQCQRLEPGGGEIFNETETHSLSPLPEGFGAK